MDRLRVEKTALLLKVGEICEISAKLGGDLESDAQVEQVISVENRA